MPTFQQIAQGLKKKRIPGGLNGPHWVNDGWDALTAATKAAKNPKATVQDVAAIAAAQGYNAKAWRADFRNVLNALSTAARLPVRGAFIKALLAEGITGDELHASGFVAAELVEAGLSWDDELFAWVSP